MPWYDRVLLAFKGVKPTRRPNTWTAYCPLHKGGNERSRSLSLWLSQCGKALLFGCWTCGWGQQKEAILKAARLEFSMLFEDNGQKPEKYIRKWLVATYVYEDEMGRPLHRACRWEFDDPEYEARRGKRRKAFHQDRWNEEHRRWEPGLGEYPKYRRVLYRLPQLIGSDPAQTVFIVEGEGKADLLTSWGLVTTTNVGGAGMGGGTLGWIDDYGATLAGRSCLLLPDNNPEGRRHMDAVAGNLIRSGCSSLGMLFLPGLPHGGDILDWKKAGGTKDQLLALAEATPVWTPSRQPPPRLAPTSSTPSKPPTRRPTASAANTCSGPACSSPTT